MQEEMLNLLMEKVDEFVGESSIIDDIEKEEGWKDRTGLDFDGLCGAIETIIFMNDRPVPLLRIKKVIDEGISLKLLHEAIQKLQEDYEKKHHGIRLVEVAEGYQFRTKAIYSRFVQDLFKISGLTLTPSCLEVLAIIAYRQPVSKFDVEKIRGVDSSHLIRTLMDKRLVRLLGRSDDMGRPSIYGTTAEFLDVFNLPDLSSLPPEYELESIIESKKVDINQISNVRTESRQNFIFDDVEELDQLAEKIRSISTSTMFTSDLSKGNSDESVRKNAFELLEDHIDKNLITQFMNAASLSETPGIPDEIKILKDLLGPFANAPFEEEDFQMIDLETGEPLDDEELEIEVELSQDDLIEEDSDEADLEEESDDEDFDHGIILDAQSLFQKGEEEDLDALEHALDAAFDKFKNAQKSLHEDSDETQDDDLDIDDLIANNLQDIEKTLNSEE